MDEFCSTCFRWVANIASHQMWHASDYCLRCGITHDNACLRPEGK